MNPFGPSAKTVCGFLVLIFGSFALSARATEQQMDPLIWKGQEVVYATGPTFEGAPINRKMDFDFASTANFKGFTATWEIKEGALYLNTLTGRIAGKQMSVAEFFPGKTPPILADWYSGTIIIAAGNKIGTMKRGQLRSVYATEIHLSLVKGKVVANDVKKFRADEGQVQSLGSPIVSDSSIPGPVDAIPARAFR